MKKSGVEGMINKAFWGKKSLKAKGKAMKKDRMAKKEAAQSED